MEEGTWIEDFDCGEMFNNYQLHESERASFGVYLSPWMPKLLSEKHGLIVVDKTSVRMETSTCIRNQDHDALN